MGDFVRGRHQPLDRRRRVRDFGARDLQLHVGSAAVTLDLDVRAAQLRVDLLLVLELGAELEGGRDIRLERVLDVDFHVLGSLS
jgi:hypothetical protein